MLLTLLNQRIAIDISREIVAFHGNAELEVREHVRKDARVALMWHLRIIGVEVRNSFTTDAASEHILMGIHQGVDASLSQFVNEFFYSIEVSIVVLARCSFNSFPHHS